MLSVGWVPFVIVLLSLGISSCDQATVPPDIVGSNTIPPGTGSSVEMELDFLPWRSSYIGGTLEGCRLLLVPHK